MDSITPPPRTRDEDSETPVLAFSLNHRQFTPHDIAEGCESSSADGVCSTSGAEPDTCVEIHRQSSPMGGSAAEAADFGRSNALWSRLPIPHCCGLFSDLPYHAPHTRVYQVWPGKNVFFFRGRMVCGPDPRGFILTTISIVLSHWIFCTYISDSPPEHSAIPVTTSMILTVIVIVNLVLAGTRDPGIVPRNEKSPLEEVGTSIVSKSRRVSINGVETKVKYCRICKIFRPPRSCHCIVCDNCVEKFDHHCPWIGQCIGLRNYRYYLMFIFSALLFFVYILAFSWWRTGRKMSRDGTGVFGTLRTAPEMFALALFSFIAIWFLGGLVIFHLYLITLNQTARENFQQRYAKSPNPYDKGVLRNIKEALFTRLLPPKVNFRAVIEPNWDSIGRILTRSTKEVNEEVTIAMQYFSNQTAESPQYSSDSEHCDVESELSPEEQ